MESPGRCEGREGRDNLSLSERLYVLVPSFADKEKSAKQDRQHGKISRNARMEIRETAKRNLRSPPHHTVHQKSPMRLKPPPRPDSMDKLPSNACEELKTVKERWIQGAKKQKRPDALFPTQPHLYPPHFGAAARGLTSHLTPTTYIIAAYPSPSRLLLNRQSKVRD